MPQEQFPFGSGSWQKAKTHCPHGHEYSPENTHYYRQKGYLTWSRACKTCKQIDYQKRYAAVKLKKQTAAANQPKPKKPKPTVCPAGHPYSGENLKIEKGGSYTCRTCHRRRNRRYQRRIKGYQGRIYHNKED